MPRPPLALGQRGAIKRTQLGPSLWVAKCRVRDFDGVTRLIERRTPQGVRDETGSRAENELLAAIAQRTAPTEDAVTAESRLSRLWAVRLAELEADSKALTTMDRYRYTGELIVSALGGLRVREATTQRLDAFLRTVAAQRGTATAKTTRSVLSGMFGLGRVSHRLMYARGRLSW